MSTFNFSTKLQLFSALREIYKDPSTPKWKLIRIGNRLWTAIQNSEVTDAQLKNAFNINDAQLATLKTKLQAQASNYSSVVSTTGQ